MFIPTSRQAFEALQPHFSQVELAFGNWDRERYSKLNLTIKHRGADKAFIPFGEDWCKPFFDTLENNFFFRCDFDPKRDKDWEKQMNEAAWRQIKSILNLNLLVLPKVDETSIYEDVRCYNGPTFFLTKPADIPKGLHLPDEIKFIGSWSHYFPTILEGNRTIVLIESLAELEDITYKDKILATGQEAFRYSDLDKEKARKAVEENLKLFQRIFPELFCLLPTR